jgi:hypothetical protein
MLIEKVMSATSFSNNSTGRSFDPSYRTYDIPGLIETMKHEQAWEKGELESKILLMSPGKKVLLTILHEGTEISSFQTDDSLTLQIIEGKLELHIREETITLIGGELLTIDEKINYSIDSLEESAFLLTLSSVG